MRSFLTVFFTADSPADGHIILMKPSDVAKNVRMVSGIVSYAHWPALSGYTKVIIFHLHIWRPTRRMVRHLFALSTCRHSHSTRR